MSAAMPGSGSGSRPFRPPAGKWLGHLFHRNRDKVEEAPFWENVDLGITENRKYLKRALVFPGSLPRLWLHRAALRKAQAFYVVNTDNALLALAAR
jgi:hypothetical protein